ncbi:Glycosyl transferase family 2 [Paracoccus solventivorans]|uniref:Glycosyl transferase family 2 n=1 Tax=Paracoccus solventivorans TaxID=53463 RepID=A0A1M7JN71_9RHOB|nr:glycosyltransferase [Paracoccus solventivorans]SHM54426.1 Glycosyl transferase family 2 [Paracoccus solventivorans]
MTALPRQATSRPPPVVILLATYQGERFLAAQLDSILAQSCRDWRLVVSDDGSTDATRELLRRFAAAHPDRDIELRDGPRQGATRNFLSLLDAVAPGEAVAWCDQDDLWLPDRLARGLAALSAARGGGGDPSMPGVPHPAQPEVVGVTATAANMIQPNGARDDVPWSGDRPVRDSHSHPDPNGAQSTARLLARGGGGDGAGPGNPPPGAVCPGTRLGRAQRHVLSWPDAQAGAAQARAPVAPHGCPQPPAVLHVARTTICNVDLRPIRGAPRYARPPGFRNALVQSCTPGNTMLIDPAGAALLRQGRDHAAAAGVVAHDWWSYLLIAGAGGLVIRDPAQTVLYRQHGGNAVGRNDTLPAMLTRLTRLGSGDFGEWLRRNIRALAGVKSLLTPENAALLERFARSLEAPGPSAAAELARIGVYRQTRLGTAALLAAAAAGRLAGRATTGAGSRRMAIAGHIRRGTSDA